MLGIRINIFPALVERFFSLINRMLFSAHCCILAADP